MILLHEFCVVMGIHFTFVELVELISHHLESCSNAGVVGQAKERVILAQRRSITDAVLETLTIPMNKI